MTSELALTLLIDAGVDADRREQARVVAGERQVRPDVAVRRRRSSVRRSRARSIRPGCPTRLTQRSGAEGRCTPSGNGCVGRHARDGEARANTPYSAPRSPPPATARIGRPGRVERFKPEPVGRRRSAGRRSCRAGRRRGLLQGANDKCALPARRDRRDGTVSVPSRASQTLHQLVSRGRHHWASPCRTRRRSRAIQRTQRGGRRLWLVAKPRVVARFGASRRRRGKELRRAMRYRLARTPKHMPVPRVRSSGRGVVVAAVRRWARQPARHQARP